MKKILLILICLALPVNAQQQQQSQQIQCIPMYTLPVDIATLHIMFDTDGDEWVYIRIRNSGKQMLGYKPARTTVFCQKVEGQKVTPEL